MLRRVIPIAAWLSIALGAAHIIYGFVALKTLNAELIWFVGAGVAMICVGLANRRAEKASQALPQTLIMCLYLAVTAYVLPIPQVFFGLTLFAILAIGGLKYRPGG